MQSQGHFFFSFEGEVCWLAGTGIHIPERTPHPTPERSGADAGCGLCRRCWIVLLSSCYLHLKINEELCVHQQHCCRPSSPTLTFMRSSHERMRTHTRGSGDKSACLLLRSPPCITSPHLIVNIKVAEFLLDIYQPTGGVAPHTTAS